VDAVGVLGSFFVVLVIAGLILAVILLVLERWSLYKKRVALRGKKITDGLDGRLAKRLGFEYRQVPEGFVVRTPEGVEVTYGSRDNAFYHMKDLVTAHTDADFMRKYVPAARMVDEQRQAAHERPTAPIEPQMSEAAAGQQRKLSLRRRRDWLLILVQLVGAAAAFNLFNFRRPESGQYIEIGRLIVCGLAAYTAYTAAVSRRTGWAWLFGVVTAIYNPFLPVRMHAHDWAALDIATVGAFLASALRIIFRDRQGEVQQTDLDNEVHF